MSPDVYFFMQMRPLLLSLVLAGIAPSQSVPTGPAVGARVPEFVAIDQDGKSQSVETMRGPKGTMLVFYRSADW